MSDIVTMFGMGLKGASESRIARLRVCVAFEGQPRFQIRMQPIEASSCDHISNVSNNHKQSPSFPKY